MTMDTAGHLRRCIELAEAALDAGDEPFGSVLVDGDGAAVAEDRNRVVTANDPTWHPEIALVRVAVQRMSPAERAAATVLTSGEHCPMCAAAHAWAGLGRIVYIHSAAQLTEWARECGNGGVGEPVVRALPIREVAPFVPVDGPIDELVPLMRELHVRRAGRR